MSVSSIIVASLTAMTCDRKFTHEGTRRKTFFSPLMQEWKDVTYAALLDTDWTVRDSMAVAPPTLWDEMFARQEKERTALLHWQTRKRLDTIVKLGDPKSCRVKSSFDRLL